MHRAIILLAGLCSLAFSCTRSLEAPPPSSSQFSANSRNCPRIKGPVALKESQGAIVTKIADGDTFTACLTPEMSGSIRVRVLGIDCPESHENAKCKRDGDQGGMSCAEQIPLGKAATTLARHMIFEQGVTLESPKGDGNFEYDNFGRVLAYVRTNRGEDFGKLMVKEAQCENYHWKYPHPRGAEYGPSAHAPKFSSKGRSRRR